MADRSDDQRLMQLGLLVAHVAHELATPLAYARASVSYVAHRVDASGPLHEALRDALLGLGAIEALAADLRVFTQRDRDDDPPGDAAEAVVLAARMARSVVVRKAKLVSVPASCPPVALSTPRLAQVVLNLLTNAAQAIREGAPGQEIRCACAPEESGGAVIVVRDTGPGIPDQARARLFEPFFTTRGGDHAGLGLHICHTLVRAAGGTISAENLPGGGCEIRVFVPGAAGGSDDRGASSPSSGGTRGGTPSDPRSRAGS